MQTMNEPIYHDLKDCAAVSGLSLWFWRRFAAENPAYIVKSGNKIYVDLERAMNKLRGGEVA